ncbi:MarR family winged helix-turn-helix transcriptional regulator [Miltoncostaea oceani]|uniref:MarR family winged helix-turn-helix transcriptional regulator n=1 Tax=Miltoncostaea oceani TaxID=2843216 RepID=UPI001FE5841A|nr:MarR family winged helix-turn-helix transcriptional regulator [Miltoncostaea oceani]
MEPTTPPPHAENTSLDPSRRVEDQLCFAIYAASRAVTSLYRPMLERLGLTYPQYLVMLALWEEDGVAVGDLAQALALDYGTLSPLLKRMEVAGLINRRRRADDERAVLVTLTERGRELDACATEIPSAIADGMGLDAEGISRLRDALQQLTESVVRTAR